MSKEREKIKIPSPSQIQNSPTKEKPPLYFKILSINDPNEQGFRGIKMIRRTTSQITTLFLPSNEIPQEALENVNNFQVVGRRHRNTILFSLEPIKSKSKKIFRLSQFSKKNKSENF